MNLHLLMLGGTITAPRRIRRRAGFLKRLFKEVFKWMS
jgi:hypothetical protein